MTTHAMPTPADSPDPARKPGEHRLHERLGTTRRELTGRGDDFRPATALARLVADAARDADIRADMLRARIAQARDNLARLSAGGRLAPGRNATVMAALGAEIDQATAQLDQSIDHLDELIDAYEDLTRPTPPAITARPLMAVPQPRRHQAVRPCPCACTRPCGCGHAGCTAR